jgi:hypothetical protein
MEQTVAQKRLVAELVRCRVLMHDTRRAGGTVRKTACRFRVRKPAGTIPGSEVVALLAISRAYERAAGNRQS